MPEVVEYREPTAAAANPASQLVAWADALQAAGTIADVIVRTNACPPAFRGKPHEAAACIVLGAELGLSPIASLRAMFDVRGQLGMYVRAQVALVQSRGHRIWTVRESDDEVVVAGHRRDDPAHVTEVSWTIARARQAGFVRRGQRGEPSAYETQPRAMLWARAAGDVARRIAADVLQGVPELDDPGDAGQAVSEAHSTPGRVIQRQPRPVADVELPRAVEPPTAVVEPPRAAAAEPEAEDVEDEPEDVEPRLTRAQSNAIHALFIRMPGGRTPEARHAYLSRWLERPIASTNDITVTEASLVIDRLQAQVPDDGGDDG